MLVEESDPAVGWAVEKLLRREGYDVGVCGGPDVIGRCVLVEDGRCPLAEGADVIINSLALSRPERRAVIAAVRSRLPDTPLIVDTPRPQAVAHASLLEGCRLMFFPTTADMIASEVRDALEGRRASSDAVAGDIGPPG